jgi:hypothetical protein
MSFAAPRPSLATVAVALLFGACAAPTLLVEVPGMIDYVNHLARMHLLAAQGGPAANHHYVVDWRLNPNLAMDMLVPALGRLIGVETAARVFLLASQALVISGALALERAVRGHHATTGLAALLVLFSLPFAWGLMNFQFGLGVALWGLADWIRSRDRPWPARLLRHGAAVALIFVSHFFALGIYGVTLGLLELSRWFTGPRRLAPLAAVAGILSAPAALLVGVMLLAGGGVGAEGTNWDFSLKAAWPLRFMNPYDTGAALLLGAGSLALLAWLAAAGSLRLSRDGAWIGAGFLALYLALPRQLLNSAYVDVRLITAAAVILPAFLLLPPRSARARAGVACLACALVLAGAAVTGRQWLGYDRDFAALKASFAHIRPGSAVLTAVVGLQAEDHPMHYGPTLAAHYAGAFVPTLYTLSGMQPLRLAPGLERFRIDDSLDYVPPTLEALTRGNLPTYARNWRQDYDYLYIIGARQTAPPDGLTELATSGRFTLYRIGSAHDVGLTLR